MTVRVKCCKCQKDITMAGSRVCLICQPNILADYKETANDNVCDDCFPTVHNKENCKVGETI